MDPNQPNINQNQQPNTPTAVSAPPGGGTAQTSPVTQAQSGNSTSDPKSNGKMILFIAAGILLLIVLGIIYFMAAQFNSRNKAREITPTPTQALPTSTPTPTPLSEKDIDTIDLGSPEADLKNIDEDVKQL